MHYRRSVLLTALLVVGSLNVAHAEIDVEGGLWEISNHIEMSGLPVKLPDTKITQCIDKRKIVPKANSKINKYCKVTEQKIEGNTVSWKMECRNKTHSEGSATYHGKSFNGSVTTQTKIPGMGMMTMLIKMKGRRIGTCLKEK